LTFSSPFLLIHVPLQQRKLTTFIRWGSTNKEAGTRTSFAREIRNTFRKFKFTYGFCVFCAIAIIVLYYFVPPFWQIRSFVAIFPLGILVASHALLPVALNPDLVVFGW
jgi:hypothetical protein